MNATVLQGFRDEGVYSDRICDLVAEIKIFAPLRASRRQVVVSGADIRCMSLTELAVRKPTFRFRPGPAGSRYAALG